MAPASVGVEADRRTPPFKLTGTHISLVTDGLGAGFGALLIMAVLAILAVVLAAYTVIAVSVDRLRSGVPRYVQYAAVGVTGVVVAVAGFAVLALADEAPAAAALFAVLVWLPLVLAAARTRWSGTPWVGTAATAGMAWSGPFLAAVGLLWVLVVHTDVSIPVATTAAGLTVVVGTVLLGEYLRESVRAA